MDLSGQWYDPSAKSDTEHHGTEHHSMAYGLETISCLLSLIGLVLLVTKSKRHKNKSGYVVIEDQKC